MSTTTTTTGTGTCSPAGRVTRSLLGYGVIAGPLYVVVSLAQALTRDGFDPGRHAWSLLANGDWGWIQIANFIVTGLMTVAFAVGLRRCLPSTWAPRLISVYGVSLVAAGIFRADPALGFPLGTPADARDVSWHGALHLACGAVGFLCLVIGCFVLARRLTPGWATFTRVTGIVFLAAFVGIASGAGSVATTVAFVLAVVLVCTWMSALALHLYRTTAPAA